MIPSQTSLRHAVVLRYRPAPFAYDLLKQAQLTSPAVDFDAILGKVGRLTLVEADIEADGYLVEFPDSSGEIIYASSGVATRRWRFTVAHELGHWVTHRYTDNGELSSFRPAPVADVEAWCDQFAEALLMPELWLRRFVELAGSVVEVVKAGPATFDVSRGAFENRLVGLLRVVPLRRGAGGEIDHPSILKHDSAAVQQAFGRREMRPGETRRFRIGEKSYTGVWVTDG